MIRLLDLPLLFLIKLKRELGLQENRNVLIRCSTKRYCEFFKNFQEFSYFTE